jgi:hypothetical protein
LAGVLLPSEMEALRLACASPTDGALTIRTATLRELEALEDEERRESGGLELARLIPLYSEDGSLARGRDRLSPVTEIRVSAVE